MARYGPFETNPTKCQSPRDAAEYNPALFHLHSQSLAVRSPNTKVDGVCPRFRFDRKLTRFHSHLHIHPGEASCVGALEVGTESKSDCSWPSSSAFLWAISLRLGGSPTGYYVSLCRPRETISSAVTKVRLTCHGDVLAVPAPADEVKKHRFTIPPSA